MPPQTEMTDTSVMLPINIGYLHLSIKNSMTLGYILICKK